MRRKLKEASQQERIHLERGTEIVLVIDTTYFNTYGVMVFRSWTHRRNIYWFFVIEETNADYLSGNKPPRGKPTWYFTKPSALFHYLIGNPRSSAAGN